MKKIGTFDIEANGLLEDATKIWCVVVKDHHDGTVHVWDVNTGGSPIELLNQYDCLIGHNCIGYDFPLLRKLYGWEYYGTKVDTLLISRTQRANRPIPRGANSPHSVEAWAIRLGGNTKVQNEVWDHYTENILARCKTDVNIQYNIFQELLAEGKGEGWELAHRLNAKLFHWLQRQEEYGWQVDLDWINHCIYTLNRWIGRIGRAVAPKLPLITEPGNENAKPFKKNGELASSTRKYWGSSIDLQSIHGPYCGVNFRTVDLDSNKEVKEFLLNLGWQPKEWNENDNGQRTSPKLSKDDPFDGVQGSLGRLISRRVQCKQRIGILEGWREAIRPDGRLSARVGGIASTGRLRHSGIVNVPSPHSGAFFAKAMRKVFCARRGWVLVGVDSKGNQVRQLAARMGDDAFTKAVLKDKEKDGEDFHSYNQELCGGIPRSRAKNFFYGFIFGARAPKIAEQIKDTLMVAQGLIDTYLKRLPTLKVLIDTLTKQWRDTAETYYSKWHKKWIYKNGYISGLDGRPILVDTEHKVLSYTLQSDEAIQLSAAYVKFHSDMAHNGFVYGKDWGMCIFMHDEFVFETRPEIAERAKEIGCEAIAWAGRFYKIKCPHEGDGKIGKTWLDVH